MIKLGEYNTLEILRDTEPGLFFGDGDENDVLLPNRYVPEVFEIGDKSQDCFFFKQFCTVFSSKKQFVSRFYSY